MLFLSFVLLMVNLGCKTSSNLLSEGSSLLSSLSSNPSLSTVTSLLKTPGLNSLLGSALKEPFTFLAPTNDAFNSLGAGTLDSLKNPSNVSRIADLLKNSIIPGKKLSPAEVQSGGQTTANGKPLTLGGANLGSEIGNDKFNIIPIDRILQ